MTVSKPVIVLAFVAVGAAIYAWTDSEAPAAKPVIVARKHGARNPNAGWDFPPMDNSVRFDKPKPLGRDPFLPAVKGMVRTVAPPVQKEDQVQIPGRLAGGEGGWAYTGMAEVDGVRMALLENEGTKKSGYVREGEDWKKAHVVGISTACIVLADEKGATETVYRFNPNDPPKVKAPSDPGFQPLNPGGPPPGILPPGRIGSGIQIRPFSSPGSVTTFSK